MGDNKEAKEKATQLQQLSPSKGGRCISCSKLTSRRCRRCKKAFSCTWNCDNQTFLRHLIICQPDRVTTAEYLFHSIIDLGGFPIHRQTREEYGFTISVWNQEDLSQLFDFYKLLFENGVVPSQLNHYKLGGNTNFVKQLSECCRNFPALAKEPNQAFLWFIHRGQDILGKETSTSLARLAKKKKAFNPPAEDTSNLETPPRKPHVSISEARYMLRQAQNKAQDEQEAAWNPSVSAFDPRTPPQEAIHRLPVPVFDSQVPAPTYPRLDSPSTGPYYSPAPPLTPPIMGPPPRPQPHAPPPPPDPFDMSSPARAYLSIEDVYTPFPDLTPYAKKDSFEFLTLVLSNTPPSPVYLGDGNPFAKMGFVVCDTDHQIRGLLSIYKQYFTDPPVLRGTDYALMRPQFFTNFWLAHAEGWVVQLLDDAGLRRDRIALRLTHLEEYMSAGPFGFRPTIWGLKQFLARPGDVEAPSMVLRDYGFDKVEGDEPRIVQLKCIYRDLLAREDPLVVHEANKRDELWPLCKFHLDIGYEWLNIMGHGERAREGE